MGFDWIRSDSWPVKWVFDPFLDERDRIVTTTHGLGGPCYGLKKTGDAPRAALRFALGYLILPLWGGDITNLSCGDCPRFLAAIALAAPKSVLGT